MSEPATDILQDIASSLQSAGGFALVTLGSATPAGEVPRAAVLLEGQDYFQADDNSSTLWGRLRARVAIHVRCDSDAEALARAGQLSADCVQTLLADPYRGGRCKDLPIGRATEVGRVELVPGLRRPEAEVSLAVRCHFEIEGTP